MPGLAADLEFRGLVHSVTDPVVLERLDHGAFTVYAGFDPTAPSLHVGNLLQLCTLRRLQLGGHRPIALAGGGTGRIGDPGGKAGERSLLSEDDVATNIEGIRPQLQRFLDFSEAAGEQQAVLLDNDAWLGPLDLIGFLREVGKHFTVNQMVAKESVKARFERPDQGISYAEFSYMLLQAYDFLQLHQHHGCDLQLGGSDQWGNITMGIELIRKTCQEEAYGLTTPLVVKADGTKFGKTESGTVWLDAARTSPYRLYQFFFNVEDAVVGDYLRFFTFLDHDEIIRLDQETQQRPAGRSAQRALARSVCELVHGPGEVARAEQAAKALFGEEISSLDEQTLLEVVEDAPSHTLSRAVLSKSAADVTGLGLIEALVESGLASSKGEARRVIAGGGAYVNNRQCADEKRTLQIDDLLHDRYVVLRKGKRDYHLLVVVEP